MKERQTAIQGAEELAPYDFVSGNRSCRPDNADIKKALSELKRDALLQQYQFFIGSHNIAL